MAAGVEPSSDASSGNTHSFVLRTRLDPQPGPVPSVALRIRLECVEDHSIRFFSEIEPLLAHLRERLEGIVSRGSP